ncbi:winged helix-turn-helix transcriptional regulator [Acinetobacter sichuanensis]|uniref:Transcriptional regulator n=1 Tax=Acinetobacter sichuanensis TaxID=2136183 RepID=A0A371YRN1_9GAMM|nr:helix-turn-helix domain-containing protein [Acinetobacter sichuanensis]RFC84123.1 transcriptional regulator [Acinetobacter sichuanensis]
MKWDDIGEQPCPIARILSVIGDRWTFLIIRNAFMGVRRFDAFQQGLGVTRHVLSERLKRLVEHEILVKTPYKEKQERFEYQLTEKGHALYPVLLTMAHWAEQWMDPKFERPVEFVHRPCQHRLKPVLICSDCGEPLQAKHIKPIFNVLENITAKSS